MFHRATWDNSADDHSRPTYRVCFLIQQSDKSKDMKEKEIKCMISRATYTPAIVDTSIPINTMTPEQGEQFLGLPAKSINALINPVGNGMPFVQGKRTYFREKAPWSVRKPYEFCVTVKDIGIVILTDTLDSDYTYYGPFDVMIASRFRNPHLGINFLRQFNVCFLGDRGTGTRRSNGRKLTAAITNNIEFRHTNLDQVRKSTLVVKHHSTDGKQINKQRSGWTSESHEIDGALTKASNKYEKEFDTFIDENKFSDIRKRESSQLIQTCPGILEAAINGLMLDDEDKIRIKRRVESEKLEERKGAPKFLAEFT
jgi:hypothetical protein